MPPNTACTEDEEIRAAIRALQAGADPDAFEAIFRCFYRPLYNFFSNRPALRQEADDLAQATLIRALQNIHQYRFEANFEAWLLRIAENVWKNTVRDQLAVKRGALLTSQEPQAADGPHHPADDVPGPEDLVLAEERTRVLREAIETLPPGMRKCAELRLYGDLEYQEIAKITGIGLNSVRSQLFEARQRLRPVLEEYFQGVVF